MSHEQDSARKSRVELILEQLDALPTLPSVASRLLRLSSAADADFRQIVTMIESDPALTSKLLGLCRRADKRTAEDVATVDRAVVLLGFEAVRAAALSVNVYELLADPPGHDVDDPESSGRALDRNAFWRFSIATACAAELLAQEHRGQKNTPTPPEAFTAGMLHGIGILALDYALPKTFGRVLQIASRSGRDLAEVERTVIGVDHHAAGRRLAERWGLPKALYDVIWLQGLAFDSLPDVPHKRTISIVNVAVAIARLLHLGWAGDPGAKGDPVALAMQAGLDPKVIPSVASRLHEAVSERSATIGMDEPTSESLLLGSIAQANRELDRIRSRITEREADTERHAWALSAVAAFQQAAAAKRAVPDVAAEIVRSSVSAFGAGCYALALRRKGQTGVELRRFGPDGRSLDAKMIEPPKDAPDVAQALGARDHNARLAELAPWLAEHPECKALGKPLKILSLGDGEPAAALLHDRDLDASRLPRAALRPLVQTWASALAFAAEAEQAQRTSQRAAEAERRLLEGQERIREAENLRRLAELATGAAEEMSKPLAVISGRCDLLSEQMEKQRDQRSLEAIRLAAERVGGLLNALKLFADPPPTNPLSADVGWLLGRAVREARRKFHADPRRYPQPKVRLVVDGELPKIWVDGEQVIEAVAEVVLNGLESEKSETIEVRAYAVPQDNRVVVLVMDDGEGMDSEALEHAFDPFFASAARGGRRQGLGLAKSRRLLGLNAGDIALRSKGGEGVIVAISLPLAPMEKVEQPAEKAA